MLPDSLHHILLKFCRIVRIFSGTFFRDIALSHQSGQIHIQGMHTGVSTRLHHCRNLVCLSLPDQVQDRIGSHQKFCSCYPAAPFTSPQGIRHWLTIPFRAAASWILI